MSAEVEAALEYLALGWCPVPLVDGQKRPAASNWETAQFDPNEIGEVFPGKNVGLRLGPASDGLVDIDFDDPFAPHAASKFLPDTQKTFGRGSGATHALYRCEDLPEKASVNFTDPEHGTLIEIRAQGNQQTMVPPSIHPSGDVLEWRRTGDLGTPLYADLRAAVARTAAAILIARRMSGGDRHRPMMQFAGALLRHLELDDVTNILEVAYELSGGTDWKDAHRSITDTHKRLEQKERVSGWPVLDNEFGPKVCKCLKDWLGLDKKTKKSAGRLELKRGGVAETVTWLWHGYMVQGELNEIVGDAGLGKSSILADFVARIGIGREWPDGQPNTMGPRPVVWISAEDSYEKTILPRVLACGGDRNQLLTVTHNVIQNEDGEDEHIPFDLSQVSALEDMVRDVKPALVIIDPLNSFIGTDIKMVDANKMRPRLEAVRDMLDRCGCTLLWIRHQRKGDTSKVVHMGSGIADITALVRASLIVVPDPDDEDIRYLCQAKVNQAPRMASMAYHIENVARVQGTAEDAPMIDVGRVIWDGADDRSAREICSTKAGSKDDRVIDATAWLNTVLTEEPRKASDILAEGVAAGHTKRTLQRAADETAIVRNGHGKASVWSKGPF